jgi:hypothetical protein
MKESIKFNYLPNNKLEDNKKMNTQSFKKRPRKVQHVTSIDNIISNARFSSIELSEMVDIIHEMTQYLSEIALKINDYYGMQVSFSS